MKISFKLQLLVGITVYALSVSGCSTSNSEELKSISGNVTIFSETGDIFDDSGDPILDQSGVSITLTNTDSATGADNTFSATTRDDGSYVFSDIPGGTYEATFKKGGIGKFKIPKIVLNRNDLNNINVKLSELPTHNIETFEASIVPFATNNTDGSVDSGALRLNLSVANFLSENKNVTRRLFYVFWGEDDNVSNTNFDEKTVLVATNDSPDVSINNLDADVYFSEIPSLFLHNTPFGSEFHIALYEVTENNFFYTDPESNSRIYSNMSESPVVISLTNTLQ